MNTETIRLEVPKIEEDREHAEEKLILKNDRHQRWKCPTCQWDQQLARRCFRCGYVFGRKLIIIKPQDQIRTVTQWEYRDVNGKQHTIPALMLNGQISHFGQQDGFFFD